MNNEKNKIQWVMPNKIIGLNRFYERNNLKAFLSILFYLLLLTFTGYFTYHFLNTEQYLFGLILLFIHGTFYSFLGWSGIGHELVHKSVFKNNFLNTLFLKIFSFLMWSNYVYFDESHKRHHKYTLFKKLDKEIVLPLNFDYKDCFFLLTFNLPSFYNHIKALIENSLEKINGEWGNELFSKKDISKKKELFNFARIILIGHIFLIILFINTNNFSLIFIITLAPFIANWLNTSMALSQHIGMQSEINDFRLNSTTIRLNWFLSLLYSNMNYHIEHHLYPNVPFYNLPLLSNEISDFLPKPINGFFNVMSFIIKKNKVL